MSDIKFRRATRVFNCVVQSKRRAEMDAKLAAEAEAARLAALSDEEREKERIALEEKERKMKEEAEARRLVCI